MTTSISARTPAQAPWDVRVLSVGHSRIRGPEVFWMSRWDEELELAFNVTLARRNGEVVLVNTSPPESTASIEREFPAMRYLHDAPVGDLVRTPDEYIERALRAVDLTPDDVTQIILTPLELYTTGTLPLFRRATISISRRGWIHFHTIHEHPHDSRWRSFQRSTLIDLVTDSWDRVRLLEDEDEVLPGLRTWWAGGHHRETIVVEIDTDTGTAAVSDAFFYAENVNGLIPIGLCENIYEAVACYERVRSSAAHIIGIHDPDVARTYPGGIVGASST